MSLSTCFVSPGRVCRPELSINILAPGLAARKRRKRRTGYALYVKIYRDMRPKFATTAEPGSEKKIRVMEERYARRESLHHPEDVFDETARGIQHFADRGENMLKVHRVVMEGVGFHETGE